MTRRIVGPKLKSSVSQSGVEAFGSLALMTTSCCCSAASRLSVANAGRCVWNFFELVPLESLTGSFVVPVIESAVEVMLTTLPWFTWSRNELYESVTVGACNADVTMLLITMLATSKIARTAQKRHDRIGAVGGVAALFGAGDLGGGGGFWPINRS